MSFIVYLRKNLVNGKCYVGQTSNFKLREYNWACLKNRYANEHINKDRESYGLDAWSVKILAECDTQEEAWELEKKYIEEFNTIYPNGYNLDNGGLRGKRSDETKQKMSESKKGELNPMYGKTKDKHHFYRKHHSDETKQKISKALMGKKRSKKTKMLEEFEAP